MDGSCDVMDVGWWLVNGDGCIIRRLVGFRVQVTLAALSTSLSPPLFLCGWGPVYLTPQSAPFHILPVRRGCHKDAHSFFFYYGIHSLMVEKCQILRYLSW